MRSHILLRGTAAAAVAAFLVVGCSPTPTPSASPGGSTAPAAAEPVTLTVSVFNEMGYEGVIDGYKKVAPHVTVKLDKAATSDIAREKYMTGLAAGSGLADVAAVEVDWLPEIMESGDMLADLSDPSLAGRWLDWKVAQATTADGKLVGYGTDIGPEGVCYRSDLFEAAGLPTDRDEVAKALGSSWDDYFALGKQFTAKSDAAWFDSADAMFQGMVNQLENPFSSTMPEETLIPLDQNTQIKGLYDAVIKAAETDDLSANLQQWVPDWQAAFQSKDKNGKGTFATMLCPGWMLGIIEGNAKGVEGWDIANTFPGGGGNWGGSFMTVPAQGKNVEEAKKLANWLTAPEQQITAFKAKGVFPSQVEALSSQDLLSVKNTFFNDAPTGQILSERAKAVTVVPFKGPHYFAYRAAVSNAINRVDVDKTDSPEDSWAKAVTEVAALG